MENISTQLNDLTITRALIIQRYSNSLSKEVVNAYLMVIDDMVKQLKTYDNIDIKNVNKIIRELQSRAEVALDIKPQLNEFAMSEATWAQSSINGAVGINIASKLPTETVMAKIVSDSYIQGATLSEWVKSVDQSMNEDMKKAVRIGMLSGESTPQIAKRVKDALGVNLNHAESISRTAVATISNTARQATYSENEDIIKGYEHSSVLDSRTSQVCAVRDGAFWDLEGKGLNEKGKMFPFKRPPLHFRCRSLLSPILKSYKELGLSGIVIPEGTRASMDGQVSSGTNFDKWFSGKDKAFQEEYLGKGRYKLYKDGKITFSDLVNQQGRTLTIQELKDKYSN